MSIGKFGSIFCLFCGGMTLASVLTPFDAHTDLRPPAPNVILLMVDGVRWQEFFHGSDPLINPDLVEKSPFQTLLSRVGVNSFVYGDRQSNQEMTVSNRSISSLPAYQSIMAGQTTNCRSNSCGRIQQETLQERLLRDLSLRKNDVATVASWSKMSLAVESVEGRTFINAGINDNLESIGDPAIEELNQKQKKDTPPWDARKDEYTFAQALAVLKHFKPRFLFISLNDADEFGHKGQYSNYFSALKGYQEKLLLLEKTLDQMGDYGQATTLLMTTDHGRGNGRNWSDHNSDLPEAKYVWIYARNPRLKKIKLDPSRRLTHLDIRPTIEKLMGLPPKTCAECGQVITELTQ